jgi:hypothetical protein
MKKLAIWAVTILAGVLGLALVLQSPASAGGTGGYPTTTKATYPTSTTKVTYPTTTVMRTTTTYPHMTTTTKPHMTTTTEHETTTTEHQTTTTQPVTTTTQPATTTTQPEMTTTTQPVTTTTEPETTTTQPNLTILSLRAVVIGGPATPADFDLFASGPIDINGITDNPNVTFRVVDPGTYALSFVADALANDPYTNMGWDCVGSAATTTESVTLDAGEDALCVITFTTQAAVTTTTVAGATTTVAGATTTAPTGTTVAPSGTTTPTTVCPTCVPSETATTTPEVQVITPASESPVLATPASAESGLPTTGADVRLGLGSGLLLIMVGGLVLLGVRWIRR